MTRMSGITIEKDASGKARYIRVDLRIWHRFSTILKEIRYRKQKDDYDPEFVAKIKHAEKEESKKINLEKYGISI